MKHTLKITLILIFVFLIAQIIGLATVNKYIDHDVTAETGNVTWAPLPYNITRPPLEEGETFWSILGAILIGTSLVFLIIKFGKVIFWKIWFCDLGNITA